MTLYGYCYYNRKAGYYTAPFFNQYGKEMMLELLERSYQDAPKDEQKRLQECDFMFVGEFDDKSGEFAILKPEFLRNFVEVSKGENPNG